MLKHDYELAEYSRQVEIVGKEDLLVSETEGFGENLYVGGMGTEAMSSGAD